MKNNFLLLLVILLVLSLTACGKTTNIESGGKETDKPQKNESEQKVYDIELCSSEWGEVVLKSVTNDGILFNVKNTSDTDYTLYSEYAKINGTEYKDDFDSIGCIGEHIASGSSRDVLFRLNLEIDELSVISGQFLVCEIGTGYHLGIINFENVKIANSVSEMQVASTYNTLLYSGEWGELKLKDINDDGFIFEITNTTNNTYTIYSDYTKFNGTEYADDFESVGCVDDRIAPGSTRDLLFKLDLEGDNISEISGQFLICAFGSGEELGVINFEDIAINE